MIVPDPNTFGGPVRVFRPGHDDWREIPLTHSYGEQSRGLGLADMARALGTGRAHRATGRLAFHVLDVMHALHEGAASGARLRIESACDRPAPMPMALREGQVDPEPAA